MRRNLLVAALVAVIVTGACAGYAQELSGPPANPNLKYSTPMPPGIAAPSELKTRFGTLKFFDGFPDQTSAEKLFDNLDFQRAVQAYLLAIPVKEFWSVIVYSDQTRSMIQTDQRFPSVSSQKKDLIVNADGSVDVYFGPKPPPGKEPNWVQTVPSTGWNTILRLYSPLAPWFDKTWRPGEIEEVK